MMSVFYKNKANQSKYNLPTISYNEGIQERRQGHTISALRCHVTDLLKLEWSGRFLSLLVT